LTENKEGTVGNALYTTAFFKIGNPNLDKPDPKKISDALAQIKRKSEVRI
jgi:hypothetical protein